MFLLGFPLLALLIAALTAPWWFDARRVAAIALERAEAATKLDWRIDGEPELKWRPRPWLALPGLTVRDAGGRLVLGARRLELALPWSTLRGESLRIEAIRLDAPDIDLDAAIEWWNAQPTAEDTTLPVLDGFLLSDGRIRWGDTNVEGLQLSLPRFAVGEPMALLLGGRVTPPQAAGPKAPFDVGIDLQATPQAGPLRLETLRLALTGSGPVPVTRATGRLQFAPWQLQLEGVIAAWPAAWPALPGPLSASAAPIDFTLAQDGESALAAEALLTVQQGDTSADARLQPSALLDWLERDGAALLPPLTANAATPRVELDGITLEGVSIAIEDIPPTAEGDAPKP